MQNEIITGIYIRVSTEDQAKDGFSINAQKEKLTKYAESNDWKIFDYYIDDGISGKNLTDRPEVNRMLRDIKNKKINNVLIYKLDRLTRSVKDLIDLIELFEKNDCTFNSQTEKIDTSNAVGRMFVKIIGIFAEFERENLAERVSFGYEQKTREGYYTNTNGVYGYDYDLKNHKLVVNELEKKLVERVFDLYLEGYSYFKISKLFNEENIPTKRNGHWAPSTIKQILSNPLYIGQVRYGLSKNKKDKSFVTDGKDIEPIIDLNKFNLVAKVSGTRKRFFTRRYSNESAYFFHFLKCSCGGTISAKQQIQRGKLYITYKCNNAIRGFCNSKGFSHNKIEICFLDYLDNFELMKSNKKIMEEKKSTQNDALNLIEINNKKIQKMEDKKKNIRIKFINDEITIDEYHILSEEINEKINSFNIENELLSNKLENIEYCFTYDEIKNIVNNLKLNWINLTNQEKKNFLEQFIDKIVVNNKDNLVIEDFVFRKEMQK